MKIVDAPSIESYHCLYVGHSMLPPGDQAGAIGTTFGDHRDMDHQTHIGRLGYKGRRVCCLDDRKPVLMVIHPVTRSSGVALV